ncbi:MAG: putative Ig domain-containing protein [Acidobacteriota bacterium]
MAASDGTFDWGLTDSFSIEFWMKTDPASTCSGNQVIVGRKNSAGGLLWVGCADGGTAGFELYDKNGTGAGIGGTRDISDGNWHHIVAVRDAGVNELFLYVDGNLEDSVPASYSTGFDFGSPLDIGWVNLNQGHHFVGTIDEVALYNRALTATEVSSHYYLDRGYCDMCSTPVAIMPAGDSITEGYNNQLQTQWGTSVDNYAASYRQKLYWDLTDAGYDFDFVGSLQTGASLTPAFDIDNEGNPGYMASCPYGAGEVVNDIYGWLVNNPADVVLLHIGTNDVANNCQDVNGIASILDEIDRYDTDYQKNVTDFNNAVLAMAQNRIATGDKIIIVNEEDALTYPDDMDGTLHPTQGGYDKMAGPWFAVLRSFLPVCEVVPPLFISAPITVIPVGRPYVYDADASGNPMPAYSLVSSIQNAPTWMNIDSITGITSGTPDISGSYNVEIQATNPQGSASQSYILNVVDCPSGTSHYWALDETGGPYGDLYGTNATCSYYCPLATNGIIGQAQLFNATSQVDVADDNTFDWGLTDSFSMEFWMKTDTASACAGNRVIVGRKNSTGGLLWVGCADGGNADFELYDKNGTGTGIDGTSDISDGNWHHIVAVRDAAAGQIRIYVDGSLENSVPATFTSGFDFSTPLNIGWLNTGTGHHFIGTVDDVALYNRALTDVEILQHYIDGTANLGYCEDIAPEIVSSPVTTAISGVAYTYDVNAMGNPAPTYSLSATPTPPDNMTIDDATGLIQWTPSAAGTYNVAVVASNGVGQADTQSFTVNVSSPVAPDITSTPVTGAYEGKSYHYDVDATGDPSPTYSLSGTVQAGMTIDSSTGLIQWTPSDTGDFTVTVVASNIAGADQQTFTITVSAVPPLPGGMIHYWTLDETDGSPYLDLYGNDDAVCVDCPTATTGIVGSAQLFTATNQVNAADDNTFDWGLTDSFSMEFWMKTDTASACAGNQVIVGRKNSTGGLLWVGCADGGNADFELYDKNGTAASVSGTKDISDGNWHHVVAVRDAAAGQIRIYVDGSLENSVPATFTSGFDFSTPLNIGWVNKGTGHHFIGTIDEVALYNVVLSDSDIHQHYTDGEAGRGYGYGLTVKRISGGTTEYYTDIQTAYDSSGDADTLETQATLFDGNLTFNQNAVTLKGGYDSAWTFHSDQYTTISGSMTISGGTVTVENLVIK